MRIVVAHNYYGSKAQGGETVVFQQEVELLKRGGHEIRTIERENSEIARLPFYKRFAALFRFGFSDSVYHETVDMIQGFRPDILHVHNYKYVLTPAIFQAAKDYGVKSVLTLHNYRLLCPCGQLRRGENVCEECMTHNPTRSLWRHGCAAKLSSRVAQYAFWRETRDSILKNVDVFIALTQFAKNKFVEGGIPASKIVVKPNFLFEPLTAEMIGAPFEKRKGAIFVGRLSQEKGVDFLLNAWRDIQLPLTIVGDGPENRALRNSAPSTWIFVGEKKHDEVLKLIRGAEMLIFPSIWYEGLPMTILEAFALGTPVVATDLGALHEIVRDGISGRLFEANNRDSFITIVDNLKSDKRSLERLSRGARSEYEKKYNSERNMKLLNEVYSRALGKRFD